MMRSKLFLILGLIIPIFALLTLTVYKGHIITSGFEVVLPIAGYDPRDLLAGHYISYRVDYGVPNLCLGTTNQQAGYVCIKEKTFSTIFPATCQVFIRGICNNAQFNAGIERYYIPESAAGLLDRRIRREKASISIRVTANGTAQVTNLFINDQEWKP